MLTEMEWYELFNSEGYHEAQAEKSERFRAIEYVAFKRAQGFGGMLVRKGYGTAIHIASEHGTLCDSGYRGSPAYSALNPTCGRCIRIAANMML